MSCGGAFYRDHKLRFIDISVDVHVICSFGIYFPFKGLELRSSFPIRLRIYCFGIMSHDKDTVFCFPREPFIVGTRKFWLHVGHMYTIFGQVYFLDSSNLFVLFTVFLSYLVEPCHATILCYSAVIIPVVLCYARYT